MKLFKPALMVLVLALLLALGAGALAETVPEGPRVHGKALGDVNDAPLNLEPDVKELKFDITLLPQKGGRSGR